MSELARRSRWCDQSILDERNPGFSSGPLRGRLSVWNSRRGNHLGQRSCASAPTGRTYGRKRSDQNTAKRLARRGPSTYGECRLKVSRDEGMNPDEGIKDLKTGARYDSRRPSLG